MTEAGFEADFPPGTAGEIVRLISTTLSPNGRRDLQDLLWSSIDNDESRDLDQIECLEARDGQRHLLIGIADVDARLDHAPLVESHAAANTTSVYAGIAIFHMLPEELSTGVTSLLQGQERAALVIDLVEKQPGKLELADLYPATVRNKAKLTYHAVGDWLEGRSPPPALVATVPALEEQLRAQSALAKELASARHAAGAISFARPEPEAVVRDGRIVDLQLVRQNPAREIIENFMVAANTALAGFLTARQCPALHRVVRKPQRWDRIRELAQRHSRSLPEQPDSRALADFLESQKNEHPLEFPELSLAVLKLLGRGEYAVEVPGQLSQGHFGLGLRDYTHSTAPNRRYADLVTQRLLKFALGRAPAPYSIAELKQIAAHCNDREAAADKVERLMRKVAAADLLSSRVGEVFPALVTGSSPKGTWVRLSQWPAEGKVVRGERGLDVGDHVAVRLLAVDREKGFIDFARA